VAHLISTLPIVIISADLDLAKQAAEFKASRKMSYADCFAAALAKLRNAELVTGDREFRQVENEVKIQWL
jgi:predicted nucleic acid-binding protein